MKNPLKTKTERQQNLKFACDECPYSAYANYKLVLHKRLMHGLTQKCPICGEDVKVLREHMNTFHKCEIVKKEYKCDYCDEVFDRSDLKFRHRLAVHDVPKMCHVCNIPDETYKSGEYNRHMNVVHGFKRHELHYSRKTEGSEIL